MTRPVLFDPKNKAQADVCRHWHRVEWAFLVGPARTGKTAVATANAVRDVAEKRKRRVIVCRPTVACGGDEIGYLPGSVAEKLDPWVASVADALEGVGLESHSALIEHWPLGMIRGRTVKDATLIVDEAQNLTRDQLRAVVSRMGRNGRIVLCGDPHQSDQPGRVNPLQEACGKLAGCPGVGVFAFTVEDIIPTITPNLAEVMRRLG